MTTTISIKTIVNNTDEVRLDIINTIDSEDLLCEVQDSINDAVANYSKAAYNGFENDIITTIAFDDVVISAQVGYSFSSQFLTVKIVKNGIQLTSETFENNQTYTEFDWFTTAGEVVAQFEEELFEIV